MSLAVEAAPAVYGVPDGGPCTRRAGAYDTRCRCSTECITLATRARAGRERRQDRGIAGRVPTGKARRAVEAYLAADPSRTLADMARLAGVSRRTLSTIRDSGPEDRILLRVAVKVINVKPEVAQRGVRGVSGTRTRREVEALMTQGWTSVEVARRAGLSSSTLVAWNLLPTCKPSTADAVHRVFWDLRYKPGPSQQAALKARRLGHLPWSCWEGRMDDPDAVPDLDGQDRVRVRAWKARQAKVAAAASEPLVA